MIKSHFGTFMIASLRPRRSIPAFLEAILKKLDRGGLWPTKQSHTRMRLLRSTHALAKVSLAMTLIGLISLTTVCPQAFAATKTATAQDSSIMFRINHDLGYTVGYFDDFTATLEVGDDPAQVVAAKIQVATSSVQTRNAVRDEGLKSALFFDAEKFPQATFESAKVEGDEITGTMTIKGVSQPVVLKVQKDAPSGKLLLKGEFNRNDFGITYNITRPDKKKSIGDIVELIIELAV